MGKLKSKENISNTESHLKIDRSKTLPAIWSEELNETFDDFFNEALERISNKIILNSGKTEFYESDKWLKRFRKCENKSWRKNGCSITVLGNKDTIGSCVIINNAIFLSNNFPAMSSHALLKGEDWKWHLFIDKKETNNLNEFAELLDKMFKSRRFEFNKCPGEYEPLRDHFDTSKKD